MKDYYQHIDKKDYRYPSTDHYPLFPNWEITQISDRGEDLIFSYNCYIRWKDYDGTMRQELKSKRFNVSVKCADSVIQFYKDTALHEFINDCYVSIFTNCEKYRNKKFINVDKYQTTEEDHFIEHYKVKEVIDALCYMDFKIGIED